MKTIYKTILLLAVLCSFSAKKLFLENDKKLIATYKGTTEDYLYKFVDDKNVTHLFYDMYEEDMDDEESEESYNSKKIDLSLPKYLGKKFELTWAVKEIDELDEEGEETGKKTQVKTILTIKEIK